MFTSESLQSASEVQPGGQHINLFPPDTTGFLLDGHTPLVKSNGGAVEVEGRAAEEGLASEVDQGATGTEEGLASEVDQGATGTEEVDLASEVEFPDNRS